jgi:Mrp family chromosome partitioning ATPase/capsular polysaccharide biosynthesis protein
MRQTIIGAERRRRSATRSRVRTAGSVSKPHGFLAARLGWIALVTLAVLTGAAFMSWSRTPTYEATADVLVQSSILTTNTAELPDMGSEKAVASSRVVLDAAAQALGVPPDELAVGLSVSVPLDTHILKIGYSSPDPLLAQQRAQALAAAYVSNWEARQPAVPHADTSITRGASRSAIITPAARPSAPSSPNHFVDLGVGLVVGLALGFGSALARDRFDDRLRGHGDLATRTGAPLLGVLPALRHKRGDVTAPLVMVRAPDSQAANAYRDLRTQVMRAAARRGAKTLLVTCASTEPKTPVVANLAVALAQADQRVIFVCADLRNAYGDQLLGAYETHFGSKSGSDGGEVTQLLRDTPIAGLRVLGADSLDSDHGTIPQPAALKRALTVLSTRADFVVVDCPPVLVGADADAIAELVDMILLVGDVRLSTRREIDAMAHRLGHVRTKVIGCVLDSLGRRTRVLPAQDSFAPKTNGTEMSENEIGVLGDVHKVQPVGGGEHQ